jgi:cell division protein FtsW (lipid II flippase)
MASHSPGVFGRYRWTELGLLIIPFLLLLLATTQLFLVANGVTSNDPLSGQNFPPLERLTPTLGLIGVLLLANVVLSFRFRKADQLLLPLVGLQSGLGVLMATRLGPDLPTPIASLGIRQVTWVLVGLIVCLATVFILRDANWLARYKYTWVFATFLFLLPNLIKGVLTFNSDAPTRDHLGIEGLLNLQPSELLKISIVIFFAGYLSENRDILAQGYLRLGFLRLPPLRQLGPLLMMLGIALLLFLVVRDLGLALLIYCLFLCMMYLGSGKLVYVIVSLAIFAAMAFIAYKALSYVQNRFAIVGIDVVNWSEQSDDTYFNVFGAGQIVQGLIALASGGILGAGLGLGHPAGRGYVPEVHTDMVLTALGEELGLAGLFAIIGIYLLITYRGYRIAIEASEPFQQLLAAGLTSVFAIQTLIISAGNLKFMPLTGITLPFLSYGGSSILVNYIIIGILLRISYNTAEHNGAP